MSMHKNTHIRSWHWCLCTVGIQMHIPALIHSQVWCMLEVAPYYLLSKRPDPPERAGSNWAFDSPPLQAGRPGGMKRMAASDDSSSLMSLTAINSTLGSRAQHSSPTRCTSAWARLPLHSPSLPAEGLELKLELWRWAMWAGSSHSFLWKPESHSL